MLKDVREGRFDPDATRSGLWRHQEPTVDQHAAPSQAAAAAASSAAASTSTPAQVVDPLDLFSDGKQADADVQDMFGSPGTLPDSDDEDSSSVSSGDDDADDDEFAELCAAAFVVNLRTGRYHIKNPDDVTRVMCGPMPVRAAPADFSAATADDKERCKKSFSLS